MNGKIITLYIIVTPIFSLFLMTIVFKTLKNTIYCIRQILIFSCEQKKNVDSHMASAFRQKTRNVSTQFEKSTCLNTNVSNFKSVYNFLKDM